MHDEGAPKLIRLTRWTPGDTAQAQAQVVEGSSRRALVAIEAFERLAALIAATAQPQSDTARRLSPDAPHEPAALLVAIRSARIYFALEAGATIDVEAALGNDPSELVLVKGEVRGPNGERAAKAELQYLIVPGAGEHVREAQVLDALRHRLLESS